MGLKIAGDTGARDSTLKRGRACTGLCLPTSPLPSMAVMTVLMVVTTMTMVAITVVVMMMIIVLFIVLIHCFLYYQTSPQVFAYHPS